MSLQNKGGPKKFNFGFPTKKPVQKDEEIKRKPVEVLDKATVKKSRPSTLFVADDEDELLASAGIGNLQKKTNVYIELLSDNAY